MSKKVLVVVDMQEDFTRGALRNEEGIKIIPKVAEKIQKARAEGTAVIFTRDTHTDAYMQTEEGKNLPVPHCIRDTDGWQIVSELASEEKERVLNTADGNVVYGNETGDRVIDKETFGSVVLGETLRDMNQTEEIREVEFVGLCTDICVISNALLAKAFLPNAHIKVDSGCCAGVTPESHETALQAMRACHVEVV
ncbi:MAG: cysteine hydrolase [Lachnospiraceae bacterium]|nr:cysteine hydrolase [Lachnospiraceae bacterium]